MRIIEQHHNILNPPLAEDLYDLIECCARICYRSEDRITPATADEPSSAERIIRMALKRGHESVIEHGMLTVFFHTNRGVTHELVLHRLAAYSQESTRYCNYGGKHVEFIRPVWLSGSFIGTYSCYYDIYKRSAKETPEATWLLAMKDAEDSYNELLQRGWRPEQAREVLPNSLATTISMTANIREWRHVLRLRTASDAHPQIRELMRALLEDFAERYALLFSDIFPPTHPLYRAL